MNRLCSRSQLLACIQLAAVPWIQRHVISLSCICSSQGALLKMSVAKSLLWLDLGVPPGCASARAGARQHRHLPLSFRPRAEVYRAASHLPLLQLYLGGHATMIQNLEPHHRLLGVTWPVDGQRPRGRVDWMEGICRCKAEWCADIPDDPRYTYVVGLWKSTGDWNRECGITHSSLYGNRFCSVFELTQAALTSQSVAVTAWGKGSHQRGCVTKEHADRALDPHPPLTTSLFALFESPRGRLCRDQSTGMAPSDLVEAPVENCAGFQCHT